MALQDLWTVKNLAPVEKCSQQPCDVPSSAAQSRRNVSEMSLCYPSYLLTSGCVVYINDEACKCIIIPLVAVAGRQSEGSGEKWALTKQ